MIREPRMGGAHRWICRTTCLNDEEDCTGVDPGVTVVAPRVATCPCGRRREARVGRVTLPIFAPGFKAAIARVGEPSPVLGWRDSWLIRTVCHACRHYYLDFRKQMT